MEDIELKPCFLTPKGVKIDYPLFIYLPGMDGTGKLLRSQIDDLQHNFDVRCLAIPRQDLSNWNILTNNVIDLIHKELDTGNHRPIYLCGESFGGCLAMKVATQSPHLFKHLILINPGSAFQLNPWLHSLSQITKVLPSWFYDVGALGLLPFLASLGRIESSDRQELLKQMRALPPQTVDWRLSLLRDFAVEEEKLQKIQQKVLLIGGGSDRLLPSVSEIERLNRILPNSQSFILPDSGHACLLESKVNLYQILKENDLVETNKLLIGNKT